MVPALVSTRTPRERSATRRRPPRSRWSGVGPGRSVPGRRPCGRTRPPRCGHTPCPDRRFVRTARRDRRPLGRVAGVQQEAQLVPSRRGLSRRSADLLHGRHRPTTHRPGLLLARATGLPPRSATHRPLWGRHAAHGEPRIHPVCPDAYDDGTNGAPALPSERCDRVARGVAVDPGCAEVQRENRASHARCGSDHPTGPEPPGPARGIRLASADRQPRDLRFPRRPRRPRGRCPRWPDPGPALPPGPGPSWLR